MHCLIEHDTRVEYFKLLFFIVQDNKGIDQSSDERYKFRRFCEVYQQNQICTLYSIIFLTRLTSPIKDHRFLLRYRNFTPKY